MLPEKEMAFYVVLHHSAQAQPMRIISAVSADD
jgi:hypothetical protein